MLICTRPTDSSWVCVYVLSAMKAPNSVATTTSTTAATCRAIFTAARIRRCPIRGVRRRSRTAPAAAMSRPTEGSAAGGSAPPLPELHLAQMAVAEVRVQLLADVRGLERRRRAALLRGLLESLPHHCRRQAFSSCLWHRRHEADAGIAVVVQRQCDRRRRTVVVDAVPTQHPVRQRFQRPLEPPVIVPVGKVVDLPD